MEELILKYFDAFTNLYGMIPMKKAYRIIVKQNPQLELTEERFSEVVEGADYRGKFYVICSEEEIYDEEADGGKVLDRLLIAEYIIIFGDPRDYEKLELEQRDRPYYVPEKEELLKYAEEQYMERNRHVEALEAFMRVEMGVHYADEAVEELMMDLRIADHGPNYAASYLKEVLRYRMKEFKDKAQAQEFGELYTDLRNHTRKHSHRGHTPFELDDCFTAEVREETAPVEKPGRNDRCPCGSGKKFKRCCIGKGIYD